MIISNDYIDNLLYSAIRSDKHLMVRKKSYFKRALQLIYLYGSVKKKKYFPENRKVVLNYLDKSYIDFKDFEGSQKYKFDLETSELKPLYIAELLIIAAFLLNFKKAQRFFLNASINIIVNLIKSRKIEALICGHPDLLISFLGFCLEKEKKEVITVQHGIYSLSSYEVLWWEKEIATTIIVYGQEFKELYITQGVQPEKVKLGTPYFNSSFNQRESQCVKPNIIKGKVIFLGQQLYKISDMVFDGYNEFISSLINYYENREVEVYYKPHPREDIQQSLTSANISALKIYEKEGKPEDLYNNFDLYFSVNSSILIELYLQQKICYQVDITIGDFEYDNFKNFTGIPMVNIQTLANKLEIEKYHFHYSPDYLNIQLNYNEYMVNLVKGLIEKSIIE